MSVCARGFPFLPQRASHAGMHFLNLVHRFENICRGPDTAWGAAKVCAGRNGEGSQHVEMVPCTCWDLPPGSAEGRVLLLLLWTS